MRATIDLDDELVREARRVLRTRTKRETVNRALALAVGRVAVQELLALEGKVRLRWTRAQYLREHAREH